ncbi:monodehydroascorbate reductase 4, peroxisomal-like [Coffea eugenioides]|uniref:monodehydroascorbate reductase 4, peroxisomal-like n=1 Tax=Coffea eugenioides TaxID=49369 RepID=UPI000F6151FA|nr:monodehydroascorbate reductase 4, peroxisomal-like [Coffea eugenioides]
MQSSNTSVYAVGDVAAFPVKMFAETRRLEHVDSARKSARRAVAAIMEPEKTGEFDYLPFFYSRVFTLSWQFYGDNAGEVIHFGDFSGKTFGAYWINKGHLVGSFLEGGTKEQYEAIAKATRLKPAIEDLGELERQGLGFALTASQKPSSSSPPLVAGSSNLVIEKPLHAWYATAGVIVAASVATFAYWIIWLPITFLRKDSLSKLVLEFVEEVLFEKKMEYEQLDCWNALSSIAGLNKILISSGLKNRFFV